MIADKITNLADYFSFSPAFKVVDEFLSKNNAAELKVGKYELKDGIYVNVSEYTPENNDIFEAHRKYADLQYIVSGEELIGWACIDVLAESDGYDAENDCELFHCLEGQSSTLDCDEGMFAYFAPNDAHRPGIGVGLPVKKLVFKIPV